VDALREAGAEVKGMTAIFTYDFESAGRKFKDANVKLFTLSDYHQLLKQAAKAGYIEDAHMETLAEWRKDPEAWSRSFSETNAA
jgi:orotate phosphoribosyltransferase